MIAGAAIQCELEFLMVPDPGTRSPADAAGVEPALGQVGDARHEAEAEQGRQGKYVVADPAAVGWCPCTATFTDPPMAI